MSFLDQNDDTNDLFTEQNVIDQSKPEKKPKYTRDMPEYWWQEEGRWDHLHFSLSIKKLVLSIVALVVIAGLVMGVISIFSPFVDEASQYGYIENYDRQGLVIKTYECNLITYKSLKDTTVSTVEDFSFSAPLSLGKEIKHFRHSGVPVRVDYKVYKTIMPWRGCKKIVAVGIDSVSADSIVPPFTKL